MKPTNKELRKAWDTCYKLLGPWEKFGRGNSYDPISYKRSNLYGEMKAYVMPKLSGMWCHSFGNSQCITEKEAMSVADSILESHGYKLVDPTHTKEEG